MDSHDLKSEIRAVLKEAAHAADHTSPLNRTDLQRLVARLRRALSRLSREHDELEIVYRALTEGLCRMDLSGPAPCHSDHQHNRHLAGN